MLLEYLLFFVCLVIVNKVINPLIGKKYALTLLKYKKIDLGSLITDELTVAEWKPLFSIKFFYFHAGNAQEIYHTHSFSAISLLIFGNYLEQFYDMVNKIAYVKPRNRSRFIYISKDRFHQITKSEGCLTLMITGPWGDAYQEFNDRTSELIVSTHGRKQVSVVKIA